MHLHYFSQYFHLIQAKLLLFRYRVLQPVGSKPLLYQETLHEALKNSLIVAASSSIFATILGTLASRSSSRYNFRGKQFSLTFILAPLVLPEIIVGVSLLIVLIQLGLPLNLWSVVLGHTLLIMPFSILIMNSAFNNLDISLEEASLDSARLNWNLPSIILPLVYPGIMASLLLGLRCLWTNL